MGILALIVALVLSGFGFWYFIVDSPSSKTVTLENSVPTSVIESDALTRAEALTDAARDVKALVENQAAETMRAGEALTQTTPSETEAKQTISLSIIDKKVSFGFAVAQKKRTIDTVVLHSSYDALGKDPYSVNGVIEEWKTEGGVAPHYLIDRKGVVYRLVDDAHIAYHAGVSKMPDGRINVNDFSIGVEILNTKDNTYTSAQYRAVNDLIEYLRDKYSIKFVVGHADIAPGRKTDPWNFDWKKVK